MSVKVVSYTMVLFLFVTQANTLVNIQFGTMMQGKILRIMSDLSFDECWSNCEQRAACASISYNRRMKLCYLNSINASSEKNTVVGVVSREKPNRVTNMECGVENCIPGEVCDTASKTCIIQECASTNTSNGLDTFGNMVFIGSKKLQRCRLGFVPTKGQTPSRELMCTKAGWENEFECVPLTCMALADIGITSSSIYESYNEGNQNVIKIFCEFISGEQRGYSFLSKDTLTTPVQISSYYNQKDHVMMRYVRVGVQYESKIEVLPHDRGVYNVSIFNSKNPDFSDKIAVKPYLFVGFIPISFGNHKGHIIGYTCNGMDFSFVNCDDNRNNYIAIYESNNIARRCYSSGIVKDGWKVCATEVESSRNIPSEAFFNTYELGMGGCGCFERSCDTEVNGIAFGLPFEY